nr:hypothetical protein [uncultured Blautia sp.]
MGKKKMQRKVSIYKHALEKINKSYGHGKRKMIQFPGWKYNR